MSNHTPTPWLYHSGAIWKEIKVAGVSSAYQLALMDRDEPETTPVERDANAKFMVHACNAHDELVRAARAMVDYSRVETPTDHVTPKELLHVRSMLVAALTKAEEPCGY